MTNDGCSCSIDVDVDGAVAKFVSRRTHKAKKEYKCMECERLILIGETYEKIIWCDADGISNLRTCAECKEIRDCFMCSYYYGGVWDEMWGFFESNPEELCVGKLDKLSEKSRAVMIDFVDELLEALADEEELNS